MDIYTKVFLANMVVIITTLIVDRKLLEDSIEKSFNIPMGMWCILSLFSIPAWLVYVIMTF